MRIEKFGENGNLHILRVGQTQGVRKTGSMKCHLKAMQNMITVVNVDSFGEFY